MPRLTFGETIEIQYASPSDMVEHLAGVAAGGLLRLESGAVLAPGSSRDICLHVPWLGRSLTLRATVAQAASVRGPSGLLLRLSDGPHDKLTRLMETLARLKSGDLLHDAPAEMPPEQRIRSMSPTLKAMLAPKANAEERAILAREADPRIIELLLQNPSLSIEEVRRIAGKLTLGHAHFARIARNPGWMSDDMIRTTLARNPRLPEFIAEMILPMVATAVLKGMVESMNTTAATRRVATRILLSRGVVVSARREAF